MASLPNDWRTLEHFETQDKVFWVVNRDVNEHIKKNDIVPCIYVEKKEGSYYVLPLDAKIAGDPYRYTAWRKLIGELYGIRVDILLAKGGKLYTLDNDQVDFSKLKKSQCEEIKLEHLARFSLK